MCDYSLEYVKSRPAKVGEKLRIQRFNSWHPRLCFPGRLHNGGLRASGNRTCLHRHGTVLRACRVARLEAQGVQPHHGNLPASQQGQPEECIMMPWSFQRGRWCCSLTCLRVRKQRCSNFPAQPATAAEMKETGLLRRLIEGSQV